MIQVRDLAIKDAQLQIEAIRLSLDDLKAKRATAELTEMASRLITRIGGAGDTLARLQQIVEEEREKAAGKARMARDTLNAGRIVLSEKEQKALEKNALADFVAAEGIGAKRATNSPTLNGSTKTIFPLAG